MRLEDALARDRLVPGLSLAALVVLAAIWTVAGIGMPMSALEMTAMTGPLPAGSGMAGVAMTPADWTAAHAGLMFLMWWIMMIAMMTPSAAPMILLHAALRRHGGGGVPGESLRFTLGYLLAWAAFSALATELHWALELGGMVSAESMRLTAQGTGGAVLLAAGLWQLSPMKHACLSRCRSPGEWLAAHRRQGPLALGLLHGGWCLGCCWALMALLFVGGVMNLWWVLGLALLVLAEKLVPFGHALARVLGVGLLAAGGWLLAG